MPALTSSVDTASSEFQANREAMLAALDEVETQLGLARAGGGESTSSVTAAGASSSPVTAWSCCSTRIPRSSSSALSLGGGPPTRWERAW